MLIFISLCPSCASVGAVSRERGSTTARVQGQQNDGEETAREFSKTNQEPLRQSGQASWYGPGFHGKLTASGETFDESAMTAAHNSLPLGSKARVTNLTNGNSVEVRINDRGPFVRGRIIDVSRAAARVLGFLDDGVATVRVERVGADSRTSTGVQ